MWVIFVRELNSPRWYVSYPIYKSTFSMEEVARTHLRNLEEAYTKQRFKIEFVPDFSLD